ncbi:hypothetical protein [Vibrio barjaei]|uniref:YrrC family ATP-dependent DNA helicase n=1 Tax=Vibrio barjaei TaxID=1676683 RepID=UPI002285227F|nr:hypothetical protein [Vibrio barjaei]MCY9873850.1 hypothetical protein [Vibrio barjaei]
MIIKCKVTNQIFQTTGGHFTVLEGKAEDNKSFLLAYKGLNPPIPLRSIEYVLRGEFAKHPRYGKIFHVKGFERVAKKPEPLFAVA